MIGRPASPAGRIILKLALTAWMILAVLAVIPAAVMAFVFSLGSGSQAERANPLAWAVVLGAWGGPAVAAVTALWSFEALRLNMARRFLLAFVPPLAWLGYMALAAGALQIVCGGDFGCRAWAR